MRCLTCLRPAVHWHHVVYQQELRTIAAGYDFRQVALKALRSDPRNMVPVCLRHHQRHHNRQEPLPLALLPDSVFEFAFEHLGPGPAHEYFARRYAGPDPRLDNLLKEAE